MSKIVLVEAISTFRMRYAIELDDTEPNEYALDAVVCEEAVEFSQEFLGEQIVSHRQITEEQFIVLCDEDNDYLASWDNQKKIDNFLTKLVR